MIPLFSPRKRKTNQTLNIIRTTGMEMYPKKLQKIFPQGANFVSTTDARCTTIWH